MNIKQWFTFGIGFLIFGYYSYYVVPKSAGFFGLSFIPNFMLVGLISGVLGVLFIICGLLEIKKK